MWIYRMMTVCPLPFALFMPIVCTVLMIYGFFMNAELEDEIAKIWIPVGTPYRRDSDYASSVSGSAKTSAGLAIAISRDGGNLFTENRLAEVVARMSKVEDHEQTYVMHEATNADGTVVDTRFGLMDVCFNIEPYIYPCVRQSPIDLFQEGRYGWTEAGRIEWYDAVGGDKGGLLRDYITDFGMAFGNCMENEPFYGPDGNLTGDGMQCPEIAIENMKDGAGLTYLIQVVTKLKGCSACKTCIDTHRGGTLAGVQGLLAAFANPAIKDVYGLMPEGEWNNTVKKEGPFDDEAARVYTYYQVVASLLREETSGAMGLATNSLFGQAFNCAWNQCVSEQPLGEAACSAHSIHGTTPFDTTFTPGWKPRWWPVTEEEAAASGLPLDPAGSETGQQLFGAYDAYGGCGMDPAQWATEPKSLYCPNMFHASAFPLSWAMASHYLPKTLFSLGGATCQQTYDRFDPVFGGDSSLEGFCDTTAGQDTKENRAQVDPDPYTEGGADLHWLPKVGSSGSFAGILSDVMPSAADVANAAAANMSVPKLDRYWYETVIGGSNPPGTPDTADAFGIGILTPTAYFAEYIQAQPAYTDYAPTSMRIFTMTAAYRAVFIAGLTAQIQAAVVQGIEAALGAPGLLAGYVYNDPDTTAESPAAWAAADAEMTAQLASAVGGLEGYEGLASAGTACELTAEEAAQTEPFSGQNYLMWESCAGFFPSEISASTSGYYDSIVNGLVGGLCEGRSDPYAWVSGNGDQYTLGYARDKFTGRSDEQILLTASAPIYFFDEGTALGAVSPWLTMGGTSPNTEEWSRCVNGDETPVLPPGLLGMNFFTGIASPTGGSMISGMDPISIMDNGLPVYTTDATITWAYPYSDDLEAIPAVDVNGTIINGIGPDTYMWANSYVSSISVTTESGNYLQDSYSPESSSTMAVDFCTWYDDFPAQCGDFDDANFVAATMCCSCGGGTQDNLLTEVQAIQNVYVFETDVPNAEGCPDQDSFTGAIKEMVNLDARPAEWGGPVEISDDDEIDILKAFKEEFENKWTEGWDDEDAGEVQFLLFIDDSGSIGTFGRALEKFSGDSAPNTIAAYVVMILMVVIVMFNCNPVKSQMSVSVVGILMAILSFAGSLGVTCLAGISLNIVHLWTLPFLMVGIGVDDMFIILMAIKQYEVNDADSFVDTMSEVFVPISMTSLINLLVFTALVIMPDVPAVFLMAETAMYSIAFLFVMMTTAFPAVLYMDITRQGANRKDCMCCVIVDTDKEHGCQSPSGGFFFQSFYSKVIVATPFKVLVLFIGIALAAIGGVGCTNIEIGLDLEQFFPEASQGYAFAKARKDNFPAWPMYVSWGELQYAHGPTQMQMVKAYEDVAATSRVTSTDSTLVWVTQFALWGTNDCLGEDQRENCGVSGVEGANAPGGTWDCSASWIPNTIGLNLDTDTPQGYCKLAKDICDASFAEDFPNANDNDSYCPVIDTMGSGDNADDHLAACMGKWYDSNMFLGGGYAFADDCKTPAMPIQYTTAGAPQLYAIKLDDTTAYVDMIKDARVVCDDDRTYEMHAGASATQCFVDGIAVSYWEQYLKIMDLTIGICVLVVAVSLIIAFLFLSVELTCGASGASDKSTMQKLTAASVAGLLIALILALSLFSVLGISSLLGVNLSAFSLMSYLMAVGFAVEFSVHIVHRFLVAPSELTDPNDRILFTMEMLSMPTILAFASSFIGIMCMAFTDIKFIVVYFFTPLILVVCITFFYGAFFLPVLLTTFRCDFLNLGTPGSEDRRKSMQDKFDGATDKLGDGL